MSLTRADVIKIAHLARLAIDEDDIPVSLRDLSNILDFVEKMNAVDTTDIEPMAHPLAATQRLRPDQVTEGNQRTRFQAVAPQVEDGLYLVPKVIE
jgi:aspartyl-tRNA(Asn)/glutamyl-tRNA(Gln) amidotransferase subunit C